MDAVDSDCIRSETDARKLRDWKLIAGIKNWKYIVATTSYLLRQSVLCYIIRV